MWAALWAELVATIRYRYVIQNYVYTSLAIKYRRSLLGYLWAVANPMARYLIIGLMFYHFARMEHSQYLGHMFLGSVIYGFMSAALLSSSIAFTANASYIKKIYVPKPVFILNAVCLELVNFTLVLLGLLALGLTIGQWQPATSALLALPATLVIALTMVGLGAVLAVTTVYFQDALYLVEMLLQIGFFITPILFLPQAMPAALVWANPMAHLVDLFRVPLLEGRAPDPVTMLICLGLAAGALFLGGNVLHRFDNRIVFKL